MNKLFELNFSKTENNSNYYLGSTLLDYDGKKHEWNEFPLFC